MLDDLVWSHLIELLQTPTLVEAEIEKRKQASRESKLNMRRQKGLQEEIRRLESQINRMLDAYQEDLLTLDELRQRTTPANKRLGTARTDLANAKAAAIDEERLDTIGQDVENFLRCFQLREERLTVEEKQQIVRLLVKEVVVSGEIVAVHHSIPILKKKLAISPEGYPLCTRRHHPTLGRTYVGITHLPFFPHSRLQPFGYQAFDYSILHPAAQKFFHPAMINRVEELRQINLKNPLHFLLEALLSQVVQRLVLRASRSEPEGERQELLLVDRLQDHRHRFLEDLVLRGRQSDRSIFLLVLGDIPSFATHRLPRDGFPAFNRYYEDTKTASAHLSRLRITLCVRLPRSLSLSWRPRAKSALVAQDLVEPV